MNFKKPRKKPEAGGAVRLRTYMEARGWYLKKLHGNKYQEGMPDYVAFHSKHGMRWIENKTLTGRLTPSQKKVFVEMAIRGEKIFILFDETDYDRLFAEYDNWRDYR